jgi:DNA polymerase III subunit epsilon
MRNLDLAIVDIETTGTASAHQRIIEVAVLKVKNGELVETFSTFVDPERPISPFIESLTGITDRDVRGAPLFRDIKDQLYELLRGSIFVAHNASFDYGFLRHEFAREQILFSAKCLCTMRLSRLLFPQYRRHNLDAVMERCGIRCSNRHRAFGDAEVLWKFLQFVADRLPAEKLDEALARILKTPVLPPLLQESKVSLIPESAGVYILYGEGGSPLYVGKSVNLRSRVLSHFLSGGGSAREAALAGNVADLEIVRTSGELGALILESHLIKKLSPLYNRKSKFNRPLVAVMKDQDENLYDTVRLIHLKDVSPVDLALVLAVFKSLRKAKDFLWDLSKEYGLCPRVLGIDKGKGECVYSQLKRCGGACTGGEAPEAYNLRFERAFSHSEIEPWPFGGPILIEERNGSERGGEVFLIDKWCLAGAFTFEEDGRKPFLPKDYVFDYDSYRIIVNYILKAGKGLCVKEITEGELRSLLEY